MAGACPVSLSVALANAGSMGALGALMSTPEAIRNWVQEFRSKSSGPLQINTWIPDPPPLRYAASEARMRAFLADWGPNVPPAAGDATRCTLQVLPGSQHEGLIEVDGIRGHALDLVTAFYAKR